jgi:hypothetical protein
MELHMSSRQNNLMFSLIFFDFQSNPSVQTPKTISGKENQRKSAFHASHFDLVSDPENHL